MLRIVRDWDKHNREYLVPHTGVLLKESHISSLMDLIRRHLDANKFTDAVVTREEVEDYNARIMIKNDPECCEEYPEPPIGSRTLGLADVIRFTRTMFSNAVGGFQRVDQAEADRRAEICANCPMNFQIGGCRSCYHSGAAAALIGSLTGDKVTPSDERLHSCKICGCFNKAQIWFPLEDLRDAIDPTLNSQLPSGCWKKI
jgi:hypothetical protein